MEVLIKLTIDGREACVSSGSTVLQAAEQLGIEIPTFCHYAKLVDIGACRMCLVEVEKMRGPQTACTTRVQEGMVVHTDTPAVVKMRQGALEFLLTNHPLDCPVCDKGGECELQNQTMEFGAPVSRFIEQKRHKRKAHPLSPFIIMDEERCVICRRCFRFLEEWAGDHELDLFDRGRLTYVSTFPERQINSPFSGNVVELCPVGALTSIPFRFKARSWELQRVPGICTLCGVGCNLTLETKANRLLRVEGRENLAVNDQWLCDRGRFGQDYVRSDQRLTTPMMRRDGKLEPASWDEALSFVAARFREIAQEVNPDVVAAVGSARASNEANYLLQKWARSVVGTNNVDFAGRPDETAKLLASSTAPLDAGVIVLVGMDALGDAPIVDLFVRRAALTKGTRVIAIGPKRPDLARYGVWLPCQPGLEGAVGAGLLHLIARDARVEDAKRTDASEWTKDFAPGHVSELTGAGADALKQAAGWLVEKRNPLVLYGDATARSGLPILQNLAVLLGGKMAYVTPRANAWGALTVGVTPSRYPGGASVEDAKARDQFGKRWGARLSPRSGFSLSEMLSGAREGKVQAMFVVESDLAREVPGAKASLEALRFLVVQDQFLTPTAQMADVVLPSAAAAEADGTFVNLANRLQLTRRAVYPPKGVLPGWKVVANLAEAMQNEADKKRTKDNQWAYASAADVWHEITRSVAICRECTYESLGASGWQPEPAAERAKLARFEFEMTLGQADFPLTLAAGRTLFGSGALLPHSEAVAPRAPEMVLLLHPKDAGARGVNTGDTVTVSSPRGTLTTKVEVSEDVAPGCVWCPLDTGEGQVVSILQPAGQVTRVKVAKE
jgi:NADH-quinone oxidoreductase subunit G